MGFVWYFVVKDQDIVGIGASIKVEEFLELHINKRLPPGRAHLKPKG